VTCVREGAVAYEDSTGCSGVIRAGEFQRLAAVHGLRHGEASASRTDRAHVLQIRLRPSAVRLESEREQSASAPQRAGAGRASSPRTTRSAGHCASIRTPGASSTGPEAQLGSAGAGARWMTDRAAPEHDAETLQRLIETFEHELQQLHERVFSPDDRAAISGLRESWSRLVDVLIGPLGHMRTCASCQRSQLRTGPRCVYCWRRFEGVIVPDRPDM